MLDIIIHIPSKIDVNDLFKIATRGTLVLRSR